jgi:hypothetical protein
VRRSTKARAACRAAARPSTRRRGARPSVIRRSACGRQRRLRRSASRAGCPTRSSRS